MIELDTATQTYECDRHHYSYCTQKLLSLQSRWPMRAIRLISRWLTCADAPLISRLQRRLRARGDAKSEAATGNAATLAPRGTKIAFLVTRARSGTRQVQYSFFYPCSDPTPI